MVYEYSCELCGIITIRNRHDLTQCPHCGARVRRIYRISGVIVKRGPSDFAGMRPEDINAPSDDEERRIWKEYGDHDYKG